MPRCRSRTAAPAVGRRRVRAGTAAAGCVAVLAAVLGAAPGPAPSTTGSVRWGECPDRPVPEGMRCGTLAVPLDHDDPAKGTIRVALARIPASAPGRRPLGSLLLNFGGPGGRGTASLAADPKTFAKLGERYDLVTFDPAASASARPSPAAAPSRSATTSPPTPSPSWPPCAPWPGGAPCTPGPCSRTSAPSTWPATWTPSAARSATRSSTTSASPTEPGSAPSTPPGSRTAPAAWSSTGSTPSPNPSPNRPWPPRAGSSGPWTTSWPGACTGPCPAASTARTRGPPRSRRTTSSSGSTTSRS